MRIIQVSGQEGLRQLMREIKVDPYGIEIMLPKAISYVIRINALPSIQANILKQEMLSLGGDVAVGRDALTAKAKYTDCLVIGSLSQYRRLSEKLNRQPFGLSRLAAGFSALIENYDKDVFELSLKRRKLIVPKGRVLLWGVVNLTPDSFSGDGLYRQQPAAACRNPHLAVDYAQQMVEAGADILDIGGESTRPGARPVALKEELSRVIPAIKLVAKKVKVPLSVDTYKPQVAEAAIDAGAAIVNDISGLRDAQMVRAVAKKKAAVVIMHCQGRPRTMQDHPQYGALIDEIISYLEKAVSRASDAGIPREKIVIDPGIGFGKTTEHNLQILKHLVELKVLGQPILVGPSRKSFIGKILGLPPQERIYGTLAASVLAANNGASFLRVHDIKEVKQAVRIAESVSCSD